MTNQPAHRKRKSGTRGAMIGVAIVVVAIAVVVPTVILGGPDDTLGEAEPNRSPSATQPTMPSDSPTMPSDSTYALDPASPWPYRGDSAVLAKVDAFQRDWTAIHPGSTFSPLFGEVYEPSAKAEIVFVSDNGDEARWGVVTQGREGSTFLVDQPLEPGTTLLASVLPGDEVARILAVAAPDVSAVRYAPDGVTFTPMATLAQGVGIVALEGDQARDRIDTVAENGQVVFSGPAPDLPSH